ncbi:MAG TPA: selenoneine biosynthesis selenosugar synthase SenB [Burkholderiales bacterium]|nr:selenoneine biosynthesis selenosugar synthase SenB [Burkholderiales bacterium]
MRIALVTPARAGTRTGNRHTALRWAAFLRAAGHRVSICTEWRGGAADAMLALHARRSHASIKAFPGRLIVALTGTDVYRDIHESEEACESIELADRLIVLQPKAAEEVPGKKVHVVIQSSSTTLRHQPVPGKFRVCVVGHLRAVKDPLRTLRALAHLDDERIEVIQLGELLEPALKPKTSDRRYRWLGSVPHARALRWLASSHAMVISSRLEGGANVVCEALRIGVPVLASRIPGNVGLLGERYSGYFKVGDERSLARLMEQAMERGFYGRLKKQVAALRDSVSPQNEARALLASVASLSRSPRGQHRA